ncbi:hypothetical protein [Kineosporia babensis]|uniref:Uncharacterized protein n=1 Tax=Kineosporia babensis TaxID=499548 RepID=A0A9X1NBZ4_9ACTN|nr:hypothetical protein [Kineosporia babensis]MCD5310890.1 hypothetical protein [Kineosporia babensis]
MPADVETSGECICETDIGAQDIDCERHGLMAAYLAQKAESERLTAERDTRASQLEQYRAWLVEMLDELAEVQQGAQGEAAVNWARDRDVTSACLAKFDEITGRK